MTRYFITLDAADLLSTRLNEQCYVKEIYYPLKFTKNFYQGFSGSISKIHGNKIFQ